MNKLKDVRQAFRLTVEEAALLCGDTVDGYRAHEEAPALSHQEYNYFAERFGVDPYILIGAEPFAPLSDEEWSRRCGASAGETEAAWAQDPAQGSPVRAWRVTDKVRFARAAHGIKKWVPSVKTPPLSADPLVLSTEEVTLLHPQWMELLRLAAPDALVTYHRDGRTVIEGITRAELEALLPPETEKDI